MKEKDDFIITVATSTTIPLEMIWQPKEDITTYELALCLQYLFRINVMPYELNINAKHLRHFNITDHNINEIEQI